MRELLLLAIHLIVTVAKLLQTGGVRAVVAESLLLKQQIIIGNRSRRRAPNLTSLDRFLLGRSPCLSDRTADSEAFRHPQTLGRSRD